jgi:hypothetical protein
MSSSTQFAAYCADVLWCALFLELCAFCLPVALLLLTAVIVCCVHAQVLLQEREQRQLAQQLQEGFDAADGAAAAAGGCGAGGQQGKRESSPLRALILTPTRELALQVGVFRV